MRRASGALLVGLSLIFAGAAHADAQGDRFGAAGYFRISTRPDLQGGNGALGFWNLYGRLLNENEFGQLDMRLDLLQADPGTDDPFADVHARIDCTSFGQADANNGSLAQCHFSQFYVEAGNVLFPHVKFRLGTQEYYHNDLGVYDFRPTSLFTDTIGLSADYNTDKLEVLALVGDAGFAIRGSAYDTILVAGGIANFRVSNQFNFGFGTELRYEPEVKGDRNAPYVTPNVNYEDYVRGEVVQRFLEEHPGQENNFPNPLPTSSNSWDFMGFVEFGGFGPIQWNTLQLRFSKRHPLASTQETFGGRTYDIFIKGLTDERYALGGGDQLMLTVIPKKVDLVWAGYAEYDLDKDNKIQPGDNNRVIWSTVARAIVYLSPTVHYLTEGSIAQEHSLNGNVYRDHADSIFQSTDGVSDSRGLQFGDDDTRNTVQLKTGFTLNPTGFGIFARPELRLLYGLQYSSQQAAYGSGFNTSLNQFNQFVGPERHWHSVISIEAEGWF